MEYFQRVSPESVGIASSGIINFLKDMKTKGIELHSLMILRHDKCAAAGWWKPYAPQYLHPLYSFSKTLTATAIGFARQEGLLTLDERLVDLFPDELPPNPSENLKKVTLHHLLCMAGGHETEIPVMSFDEKWIEGFLAHPFLHEPGTFYKYNTPGTNMLAAVIKRKTGQNVTEYLRPRLLDPLGIGEITCLQLPDKDHVEMGGGGMQLCTEDMARFATFLLHRGCWEGKRLLEDEWFDHAVVKQIETAGDSEGHVLDWAHGYGYQCWMCALPGSYRADGAFGQFGFVFPTLDTIIVTTMAAEQTQTFVTSMMNHIVFPISEEVLPESEDAKVLESMLKNLELPALLGHPNPNLEERIHGKVFASEAKKEEEACSSMELLVGGAGRFIFIDTPIEKMWFTFGENMVNWHVLEGGTEKVIAAARDNRFSLSTWDNITYAASARYRGLNTLELEIRRVDAISGVRMIFRFDGDRLTFDAEDTLITVGGLGITQRKTCVFTA